MNELAGLGWVWPGAAWLGTVRLGLAGQGFHQVCSWLGQAWRGLAWLGKARVIPIFFVAGHVTAGRGASRQGTARLVRAWQGSTKFARGLARQGAARQCAARHGTAGLGLARLRGAWLGTAWQGKGSVHRGTSVSTT